MDIGFSPRLTGIFLFCNKVQKEYVSLLRYFEIKKLLSVKDKIGPNRHCMLD